MNFDGHLVDLQKKKKIIGPLTGITLCLNINLVRINIL